MIASATVRLTRADLIRLTRRMSPSEREAFLRTETDLPADRWLDHDRLAVASLSEPGVWRIVNAETGLCDCPSRRNCWHVCRMQYRVARSVRQPRVNTGLDEAGLEPFWYLA